MDSGSTLVNAVDVDGTPIRSVNQRNSHSRNDSEAPLDPNFTLARVTAPTFPFGTADSRPTLRCPPFLAPPFPRWHRIRVRPQTAAFLSASRSASVNSPALSYRTYRHAKLSRTRSYSDSILSPLAVSDKRLVEPRPPFRALRVEPAHRAIPGESQQSPNRRRPTAHRRPRSCPHRPPS
jgi:hypothetical protein